jgi:hypothetical protein
MMKDGVVIINTSRGALVDAQVSPRTPLSAACSRAHTCLLIHRYLRARVHIPACRIHYNWSYAHGWLPASCTHTMHSRVVKCAWLPSHNHLLYTVSMKWLDKCGRKVCSKAQACVHVPVLCCMSMHTVSICLCSAV